MDGCVVFTGRCGNGVGWEWNGAGGWRMDEVGGISGLGLEVWYVGWDDWDIGLVCSVMQAALIFVLRFVRSFVRSFLPVW